MNLVPIFLTGLTVGGLSCLAVQGGLLTSIIASRENETVKRSSRHAVYATISFLLAKIIAYTLVGFLLGLFGKAITPDSLFQSILQGVAGMYMILVGLNLLEVHPLFRYVVVTPPRFILRLIKNESRSKDFFAPAILGFLTIFIPCGTTLAVEAYAIGSSSPLWGALILFSFILGTIPLFLGIGIVTALLGDKFKSIFLKVAAFIVIILGVASVYGALVSMGIVSQIRTNSVVQEEVNNKPVITITSRGYSPEVLTVKKDVPVELTLITKESYTCANAFRIPKFNVKKNLGPNETVTVTFTPTEAGEFTFTCSMGMYSGVIKVI